MSEELVKVEPPVPAPAPAKRRLSMAVLVDQQGDAEEEDGDGLAKRELSPLDRAHRTVNRLSFTGNPYNLNAQLTGMFRLKVMGLPDPVLKRMAVTDSLVGTVILARQQQVAPFGRRQEDRFKLGLDVVPDKRVVERMGDEERRELYSHIDRAIRLLENCGHTDGLVRSERTPLEVFLKEVTRSALTVGRVAVEVVRDEHGHFHRFRAVDAGTCYPVVKTIDPHAPAAVRERSEALLRKMYGDDVVVNTDRDTALWDEFSHIQVIDGQPIQAFTEDELIVQNFYPVPDIEWAGFPCTPLDIAVAEVLTHLSITNHNRLYFVNGRAARGMIVIRSDDADAQFLLQFRQEFMAAVNGNQNAHRMPVFAVGKEDEVQWQPIDNSSRDMEFQYLSDNNVRAILSAFQMSPEELPGYSHLSRGTNSQSLAESSQEYILEAHRDLGIRPLLSGLERLLDQDILPLIDPQLAKVAHVKLAGLEAKTLDQEDADLQRAMAIDGTLNEALEKRQKKPIPRELGGDLPLNETWWARVQMCVPQGIIMEKLFGVAGASKDPQFQYLNSPFWFQWQQVRMEMQQMQAQAQAAQQQPHAPPGDEQSPQEGGDHPQLQPDDREPQEADGAQ